MSDAQARRDNWSRYWASGALHSCASSFDGNYADEIGQFWRSSFAPLTAGARVLDLATGNGALPRLLVAQRGTADVRIDAIDLAEVRPAWLRELPPPWRGLVSIRGGIAAEALPFEASSFDLVISQYGLEYTELARACAELRRVLKPAGRIALLVHHQQSLPVRIGALEAADCHWLLASGGLLDRARRLMPYLARLATPAGMASVQRDPQAGKTRERLNGAMRALEERARGVEVPDVLLEAQSAVGQVLSAAPKLGERAARERLQQIAEGLAQAQLRQSELVRHALDRAGLEALAARLGAPPAQAQVGEVRVRGELFGWTLQVLPPSA